MPSLAANGKDAVAIGRREGLVSACEKPRVKRRLTLPQRPDPKPDRRRQRRRQVIFSPFKLHRLERRQKRNLNGEKSVLGELLAASY